MKKLNLIAVAFLLSASLFGQSNKEDIDLIQSIFGKEKKEVVQAIHDHTRSTVCKILVIV